MHLKTLILRRPALRMQNRKILFKFLLAIAAVSFFLIIVELSLHFFYPIAYRMPTKKIPNDIWRELIHRASPVPGLSYELVPNRTKDSVGAIIKTNSFGMRDDEPHAKSDTTLHRIAALGDSFTFGFGIRGEDAYPNVLERKLNAEMGGRRFEVLNFGVGGYSTRDEALVLKYKAAEWNPDLIIIGYYLNDPEIDPIQPVHSYYQDVSWWQYSNVLRLVVKAKFHWDIKKYGGGDYFRYLHAVDGRKWQSVVASFEEIKRIAAKRKTPVLLVIFPQIKNKPWADYPYHDLHHQVSAVANENGIDVIDLFHSYSRYPGNQLSTNYDNTHPSELGHILAANAIYRWIAANKAVKSP